MTSPKWNWETINAELKESSEVFETITELSKHLSIPRRTVSDAIRNGSLDTSILSKEPPKEPKHGITIEENGNTAWVKYDSAEPVSPEEAMEIGGFDSDIWEIEKSKVNMWQMGRKDKQVSLEWIEGVQTGTVEDTGKLHKTYLYQIRVDLTRRQRIPVIPVIKPIEISTPTHIKKVEIGPFKGSTRVLFITDPHFGFRVDPFTKPIAFHDRKFLGDLLAISIGESPHYIIWGGDLLDLADFSKFPKEPAIIHKTQMAGIEAAWVINQFSRNTKRQIIIEGNHDVRLRKAMAENFSAAYELRPVYDLDGDALLSVPRFLGFDKDPRMEWIGGYPNGFYQLAESRFEHGYVVRKGSGATALAISKERTISTFFGHIHRAEKIEKYIDGREYPMIIGTPGCACRKEYTPGATRFHNWQKGAFLIHFTNGQVSNVEDIRHLEGRTYFRGAEYRGADYIDHMKSELDPRFVDSL